MNEIEKSLQALRDIYVNYPKQLEIAQQELRNVEDEIQDILHIIELASLDAIGMTRSFKDLRNLRVRRRELKNEIELLKQVNEINSFAKPNERIIGAVVGKVRTTLHKQNTRKYKMRVRKDMQHLVK